jgi:NitT/TauT family transport system substrate-binding protein
MQSIRKAGKVLGAVVAGVVVASSLAACGGGSGSAATDNNIKLSFSEVVADQLPVWIAQDSGLFQQQGLNVTLTNITSSQGFPALISGQTQLASIGASEMVAGAASGAQVSYLATLTPVFPYELFSKVSNPMDLKGKRIGITSTSGSLYVATLEALKQLGLSPQDVQMITLGSVPNVNNALIAGSIDAAVSHPPASEQIQQAGLHSILDLASQKIPTSNVGIAATKDYVSKHRDQLTRFMTAIKQGIAREKSDETYSISVLEKHLNIHDQQALKDTYQYYAGVVPTVPVPTVDQMRTSQVALQPTLPALKNVDVSSIVDASFFK